MKLITILSVACIISYENIAKADAIPCTQAIGEFDIGWNQWNKQLCGSGNFLKSPKCSDCSNAPAAIECMNSLPADERFQETVKIFCNTVGSSCLVVSKSCGQVGLTEPQNICREIVPACAPFTKHTQ